MTTTLDLEAEYDNRARVPEHPVHLAAWARDAAAYRVAVGERAVLDVPYGERPRQRLDIFQPARGGGGPIALFLHGGYWQGLGKSSFSHMAAGPNALGLTVAVAGYTLCPEIAIGGIVEEARAAVLDLARRFERPILVYGHSAGGHLAAAMVATDWAAAAPTLGFDPVLAALPVSGVFDLGPLVPTSINGKLGLDAEEARRQSPLYWTAPRRKRVVAVVGGDESSEFLRQTRDFVERWGAGGAIARAVEIAGANHFTVIAPFADPDSDLTRGLAALAKG
jgi:arylformamidase